MKEKLKIHYMNNLSSGNLELAILDAYYYNLYNIYIFLCIYYTIFSLILILLFKL